MDAVRKALDKVGGENNSSSATVSSSLGTVSSSPGTVSSSLSNSSSLIHVQLSPPQCHSSLILTTAPREAACYGACSKLCALFFVAGVVFGYTQRRRVRRWTSRVLRRFTDK